MKVLMTTDTIGGVWRYSVELALALENKGVEFALAIMGRKPTAEQRAEAARPNIRSWESDFRLEWMDDPWEDVKAAGSWLLAHEESFRPDVIHLNGYAHGALPWSSPVLVACHSCVLSWWLAVKGRPAPDDWGTYKESVSRGLGAAHQLVAPTTSMRDAIRRHYGVIHKRFAVIPNGRTPLPFREEKKEDFILCAGRLWDEAKNIAALRRISAESPWPIYAAGDDAGSLGLLAGAPACDRFHFLGPLSADDLAAWMSRAAIYCLPARYEPFGLSVLEAAYSGCALLLSDIPALRENWEDAAVFVPVDDREALLHAVCRLASDPQLRAELGERARRRARSLTPQRMAEQYLRLYRELLLAGNSRCDSKPGKVACAS